MPSQLKTTIAALTWITGAVATGKRGLNYNNATWANYFKGNSQVTWGYNWGVTPQGLDTSFEYVPMLWGLGSSAPGSDWTNAASSAKNVLTFNEPDLGSQANIIPSVAAAGYKAYVQPYEGKTRISGPAVTNGGEGQLPYMGLGWMDAFNSVCTGCTMDFQAIHWYNNATADEFKSYLTQAHQRSGKNLWITEFMLQDSEAAQIAFLQNVMPWMDQQSWIERYSYFGVFETFLINAAGNGLSNIGTTYATYTG